MKVLARRLRRTRNIRTPITDEVFYKALESEASYAWEP